MEGASRVRYSTDNGLTWGNERQLAPASPFTRNVQLTGDWGPQATCKSLA